MAQQHSAEVGETKRNISSKKSVRVTKARRVQAQARIKSGVIDLPFLMIVMVLLVFGIVMMFSASYVWALYDVEETGGDGAYYMKRQVIWAAFGLLAMLFFSYFDYHILQKKAIALASYIIPLILLILVAIPGVGVTRNGATRWLKIGPLPQFQPSEFMKLGIIIFFSYLIARNYKEMKKFKCGILMFGAFLMPVVLLMMKQPHLSGTLLICAIAFVLIFVGGARILHFMILAAVGVAGIAAFVLYKVNVEGFTYFMKRIESWRDPFSDMLNSTWQTCQSLIAIGSGGVFGLGLGNSRQKYLYLPETKNDFVFAIVCEELGFVGAMVVIILFVLFVFRGFYIASKACDKFGMMLAMGLTVQIGIQAFLNIAVVTNAVPNTGISLPFFSYGGTALLMQLAQMGIMLNISRQASLDN
ncbi:MAG: putative lipid II flippase FtsW [Oscillospiraceae bacterium]|nr:putative lipid II flippase FtsW [Oscillospiraceae bacterium]